ncbi:uncharacterized protein LOC115950621 [Quercus lobata]|uniref:uncharacterized protein LOC115950621 n=1 Tax=Quercus lobata TaxID=97700 RepID=UPI0012475D6E|nr:uncharacterized protein LOC115950621 [Quercus lobata]
MIDFQFPKNLCEQLDAIVCRFWWNPKSKSGPYWTPISWSSSCRPQKEGGLGFRKFRDFNQALLSKLAWWVLYGKDCLCIEVLRAKYKVHHNWLNQAPHSNASLVWKSLIGTKHLLSEVACLLVGNGKSIRTWSDPWVPNLPGFIPSPKFGANPDLALIVSQLLNQDGSGWDIAKLWHFFEDSMVDIIMQVPLPSFLSADCWSWTLTNLGKFTIKFAYWLGRISSPPLMMDLS